MGHLLNIESDEAVSLATELAALRGESLNDAVTEALRAGVERERARHEELAEMTRAVEEFHALLGADPPSPDHDWLYDENTGLPR